MEHRAQIKHTWLIIDHIRKRGSATLEDLEDLTSLRSQTVSYLIRKRSDLVDTYTEPAKGRPRNVYRLKPHIMSVVGVDVSRTRMRVAIADLGFDILAELVEEITAADNAAAVIDTVAEMVRCVVAQTGTRLDSVMGVGVGLPAPVSSDGRVTSHSILKGWMEHDVEGELGSQLGLPVEVNNDANLGALGELALGAAQGCRHLLYVQATTGIGCGLIVNGKLYRGQRGIAGEAGHMVFDWLRGRPCRCGNKGCLEAFAGGEAIAEGVPPAEGIGKHLSLEDRLIAIIDGAYRGNPACRRVLKDAGRDLGIAVANLCNVLDPDKVVIGSTLARAGDMVLDSLRESVRVHTGYVSELWDRDDLPQTIVAGRLQERAEVFGAMVLVVRGWNDRFVRRLRTACRLDPPA